MWHTYNLTVFEKEIVRFNYEVVQLNRFNWHNFAHSDNPIAAALMPKMNVARSEYPELELICNRLICASDLPSEKKYILLEFKDEYLALNEDEVEVYERLMEKLPKSEKEGAMGLLSH